MPRIKMYVVPQPRAGTAPGSVVHAGDAPIFHGKGDRDYLCGSCELLLLEAVAPGESAGVIIRCPACASFNQIEPPESLIL